jgi:ankyrin repeat protein
VNYNNGEVFIYAIRNFRPETFHLLLGQGLSYKALFTAVLEALKSPREDRRLLFNDLLSRLQLDHLNTALKHVVLEEDTDLAMVQLLLDAGAEPAYEDGLCIKHAASTLDRDLLGLLSGYLGHHGSIYNQAFSAIIHRNKQWIAFEHVEIIDILLQHGATGSIAGKAMVEIVDHLVCQETQEDLAETLLRKLFAANVDVNHENGKAISIAASRGDTFLLSLLLANGATAPSATLALASTIMAHHDESLLLQLIDIFADQSSAVPDFNRSIPGMPAPIFQCLKSYGNSEAVLDSLVRAGCLLEATIPMQVFSYAAQDREERVVSSELEPASVLMWALLQEEGLISPAVMAALVRHGGKSHSFSTGHNLHLLTIPADISYSTPKSRTTPLLLAVKSAQIDMVHMLIESGARVSAKDAQGHSALFYAARAGHVELVQVLLGSRPIVNDGSLHEASRGFHVPVMKLLLEAGHDSNFRSIKHGGRTALGEIALNAAPPADIAAAEEALDLLASVDASPLLKVHGKTIIFLALDNRHNEVIARLLLDRMLYKTLNSHENTYQQGTYHYSPTTYVAKGILLGTPSEALLQMLNAHGCEDRFYATMEETQPPDAVGMPEEIREYERERRARERQKRLIEEDHANTIRREREKALALAQLEDDKHHRTIQQRDDISQQHRRHRGLDHHQTIQLKSETHHNDSQIKLSAATVHSTIRWQHHTDALAMRTENHTTALAHHHLTHTQHLTHRRDKLALDSEAHTQHLTHHRTKLALTADATAHRHAQALAHLQNTHHHHHAAREETHTQQLTHQNARMIHEYEALWKRQQLERAGAEAKAAGQRARVEGKVAGARERHEMKMTELRTQRGNIIGQVNLGELRRWQEEGGGGGGGYGGGGALLTGA